MPPQHFVKAINFLLKSKALQLLNGAVKADIIHPNKRNKIMSSRHQLPLLPMTFAFCPSLGSFTDALHLLLNLFPLRFTRSTLGLLLQFL